LWYIVVNDSGNEEICSREVHPLKALLPIVCNESLKTTEFKLVQVRKASAPRRVTASGNTTSPLMPVQPAKAPWIIEFKVLGKVRDVMFVHFQKALYPIVVIV
jgi:hypothetical protein